MKLFIAALLLTTVSTASAFSQKLSCFEINTKELLLKIENLNIDDGTALITFADGTQAAAKFMTSTSTSKNSSCYTFTHTQTEYWTLHTKISLFSKYGIGNEMTRCAGAVTGGSISGTFKKFRGFKKDIVCDWQ